MREVRWLVWDRQKTESARSEVGQDRVGRPVTYPGAVGSRAVAAAGTGFLLVI